MFTDLDASKMFPSLIKEDGTKWVGTCKCYKDKLICPNCKGKFNIEDIKQVTRVFGRCPICNKLLRY